MTQQRSDIGPELCTCVRKDMGEALVGVRAGRALSRESGVHSGCRRRSRVRKALPGVSLSRDMTGPRAVLDPRHARKLSGRKLGDPPSDLAVWRRGPHRESHGSETVMYGRGKSDRPVVPKKPVNKGRDASWSAERAEGRGLAKGNSCRQNRSRTLSRARRQYGEPYTGTQRETAETAKGTNLR